MGILYYNAQKRKIILSKSAARLSGESVALAEGTLSVNCRMSQAGYMLDIGELKDAILVRPLFINGPATFYIEPQSIAQHPKYSPDIQKGLSALRNSRTLNQCIWDYLGINVDEFRTLGEVTSIRTLPSLSAGRNPMRLCEAYVGHFGVGTPVQPLFFTTPYNRSLGRVAQYHLRRNPIDEVEIITDDRGRHAV